jgi:hypothetical protein
MFPGGKNFYCRGLHHSSLSADMSLRNAMVRKKPGEFNELISV